MDVLANDIAKGRIFSALSLFVEVPTAKPDQCLSLTDLHLSDFALRNLSLSRSTRR